MTPIPQRLLRLLGASLLALGMLLAFAPAAAAAALGSPTPAPASDEPARVIAGDPIHLDGNDLNRCAIGAVVTTSDGTYGFLTSYMCGNPGDTIIGPDGRVIGTVVWSSRQDGVAFVELHDGWIPTSYVRTSPGQPPTRSIQGSREASIGAAVCRAGSATGWHCGTIQAKNQSIRFDWGTMYGLTRTSVCAEAGDLGGPFISGNQIQGFLIGGTGSCRTGGTTYFVPINPILAKYNLHLFTG
ncbi:hypothetical protein CDO52_14410 [Nocardiopsis gilva YIM 90087]|uniref:Peptidase S1 domain-containing protein n=1 Tax=Nocardiopsis gilva YIM 90087 TaxID=1235441 RepID=A0A223S6S2_9ACTN|nr:S1 family peptidase [Nocardiopsis gilva]ASU83816.1 hypothetical protein CDO52_14410 [Nocardiopsis gilva YIM 90087]